MPQFSDRKPEPNPPEAWYIRAFSDEYLYLYAHRTEEEAAQHVRTAVKFVPFQPGQKILDIACGTGRHLLAFARLGAVVTGIDLSATLLNRARERFAALGVAATFKQHDMRHLRYNEAFDGATMWFTSFGYFSKIDDDFQVLEGMQRALKPDGWWWCDLPNPNYVRETLIPATERTIDGPHGRAHVREERRIDGNRVVKVVTIVDELGERSYEERVRLYTAERFGEMVRHAGLVAEGLLGDYDGSAFTKENPRQIWYGRKPGPSVAAPVGD